MDGWNGLKGAIWREWIKDEIYETSQEEEFREDGLFEDGIGEEELLVEDGMGQKE